MNLYLVVSEELTDIVWEDWFNNVGHREMLLDQNTHTVEDVNRIALQLGVTPRTIWRRLATP